MSEDRRARILEGYQPVYPLTVRTLADHLYCRQGIMATCRNRECEHRTSLDLAALAEKLGRDTPVDALLRAMVCSACGRKGRPDVIITTSLRVERARDEGGESAG